MAASTGSAVGGGCRGRDPPNERDPWRGRPPPGLFSHRLAVELLEVLLRAVEVERHEPVRFDLAGAGDGLAVRVPVDRLALDVVLRDVAGGRALDVHAEGLLRQPRLLPR